MEQVIDWLNENELRAYPLLDDADKTASFNGTSWVIRDNFLLDLQLRVPFSLRETIQVGDDSFEASSPVFLRTISYNRSAGVNSIEVVFGTADQTIAIFDLYDVANLSYPYYLRLSDGCLAVFGSGVLNLVSEVTANTSAEIAVAVEPSVCLQFNDAWLGVNSLRTNPEKNSKDPSTTPLYDRFEPALPLENSATTTSLNGDVKLLAGYNFRVEIARNLIDLTINSGYGLVANCSTSFIPEIYLDCSELVSYINGIPPDESGFFRLNAGSNIVITPGTALASFEDTFTEKSNKHSLFIGLTFKATDLCAPVNVVPV